ncbi:unnamed protein product, partial [Cladocopium goreaui]
GRMDDGVKRADPRYSSLTASPGSAAVVAEPPSAFRGLRRADDRLWDDGEFIDEHLGLVLGLSTMASAAAGQVVSDFTGVIFGGTLEAAASKLGLPHPRLSDQQRQMSVVKFMGTAGSAVGGTAEEASGVSVTLGADGNELQTICKTFAIDGPAQFEAERYFLDSDPSYLWTFAKRWQLSSAQLMEFKTFTREQNYSDLVSRELATGERWRNGGEMDSDGAITSALADLNFKASEIAHLALRLKGRCESPKSQAPRQLEKPTKIKLREGGTKRHVAETKLLLNVPKVFSDPRFAGTHRDSGSGTRACSVLVCPILSRRTGEVLGMFEVINKKHLGFTGVHGIQQREKGGVELNSVPKKGGTQGGTPGCCSFTEVDEKLILMMCGHAMTTHSFWNSWAECVPRIAETGPSVTTVLRVAVTKSVLKKKRVAANWAATWQHV